MKVTLPWPDRRLSPNARLHWAARLKYKKAVGELAFYTAAIAAQELEEPLTGALRLRICFHPPDKRRRDQDNLLASMKAQLDSVCHALMIDDSQFKETVITWGEPVKGGCVVMTVEEI